MRDTELYERLLGLKEPWKVEAVKMDVEGRRVEVEVECAEAHDLGESGRETTAAPRRRHVLPELADVPREKINR